MIKLKCNACDGVCDNELDIRFGTACDNNCPFCFTRNCGKAPMNFNLDAIISEVKRLGHREVIYIVGGEPLLEQNLDNLLICIKNIRSVTDKLAIVTSLPYISPEKQQLFDEIMSYVDYLIVSIQHYNPFGNNILMRASNNYDRIDALKQLAKNPKYSAKLSVTMNLSKRGISTEKDVVAALKLFESFGIKTIRLNELSDKYKYISLKKVLPKLRFKSPFAHGCSIDITKYFKTNYNINRQQIKARVRCFRIEPTQKASVADKIKIKLKEANARHMIKHGKTPKYYRDRNTVIYEDGHSELGY